MNNLNYYTNCPIKSVKPNSSALPLENSNKRTYTIIRVFEKQIIIFYNFPAKIFLIWIKKLFSCKYFFYNFFVIPLQKKIS